MDCSPILYVSADGNVWLGNDGQIMRLAGWGGIRGSAPIAAFASTCAAGSSCPAGVVEARSGLPL